MKVKWLIPLIFGAMVPVLVWFFFFRDPMAGTTGVRMSDVRAGAEAIGITTDESIISSEIETRARKTKHLSPEDWRWLQGYYDSKNVFLQGGALFTASLADDPSPYRDTAIQAAWRVLQDPRTPDSVQSSAMSILWRKNAPGWQQEFQHIQMVVNQDSKRHNMVVDELKRAQAHQRQTP